MHLRQASLVKTISESTRGGGYVALLKYGKKRAKSKIIIKKRGEAYGKRGAQRKIR